MGEIKTPYTDFPGTMRQLKWVTKTLKVTEEIHSLTKAFQKPITVEWEREMTADTAYRQKRTC